MREINKIVYPDDMAGAACQAQSLIPDAKFLPLYYTTLKFEHENLKREFEKLVKFLAEKGLDYE